MWTVVERHATTRWSAVATVVVGGLGIGIVTQILQGELGAGWNVLANSGAVWLIGAFFLSSIIQGDIRTSVVAGWGVLAASLLGYYAAARLLDGAAMGSISIVAVWFLAACIGGPVFGIAGSWWRGELGRRAVVALALLGGVLIAEGAYLQLVVQTQGAAGWVEIAIGILVPVLLGRTTRTRLFGLAGLPLVALLAYAIYLVLNGSIQAIGGV